MSDDDPFAEPDDTERTVVRPNPGGRLTPTQPSAPAPQAQTAPASPAPQATGGSANEVFAASQTGSNRLNAAATPLFSLVSRLRNRAQHSDPDAFRQSVANEVRAFEIRAAEAGVDSKSIQIARYAICATLDDVVLNTPWGGQSTWAQTSMVATFHREVVGGDRFFDVLAHLEKNPGPNIDLLEFFYSCLSLGFEGRLRVSQGGAEKHMDVRQGLAGIIRAQRGQIDTALSPHWQGVDQPYRERSFWKPVWLSLACLAGLLGLTYGGLSYALNAKTENAIGQMLVVNPATLPTLGERPPFEAPPAPVEIDRIEKVSGFLEPEIAAGIVEVFKQGNTITIRITGSNMFAPASDRLTERFIPAVVQVAQALNDEAGRILVAGHSDSDPISSRRFNSNMELSIARAETVRRLIATRLDNPLRIRAEGRADKQPIASNDTADGKARNRRIEVLLIQEGGQP